MYQEGRGARRVELASGGRWHLGGLDGELGSGELGGGELGGGELDDDVGDFGDRFHQDDGLADVLINFFAEEPF